MRDTEEKRKRKSKKTESFIHCVLNSSFSLFHCLSPDFSFQRLRKAFSYLMAIKIHDRCLAPSIYFLPTLLLLWPMPLSLPTSPPLSEGQNQCPWWEHGNSTSLNHHSFGPIAFAVFRFPSHTQFNCWNELLGTYLALFWESQNQVLHMM